jgi:hypothetical protein
LGNAGPLVFIVSKHYSSTSTKHIMYRAEEFREHWKHLSQEISAKKLKTYSVNRNI